MAQITIDEDELKAKLKVARPFNQKRQEEAVVDFKKTPGSS